MPLSEQLRVARHEIRRVGQTPRAFVNWPTVLSNLALEKAGRGAEVLHFDTRTGLQIECPNKPGARVPIYEIFAEDCYRFDWFVGAFSGDAVQVLDIGGHVGTFACRLAQVLPLARVQGYEPSARTSQFYAQNAARNGFADRISVTQAALSDRIGTADFGDNLGGSGTNGLIAARPAEHSVLVDTTTFDAAVAQLPAPPVIVKMDCEGGEYDLVYASDPASWSSVRRLVLEYHEVDGQSWSKLRAWFADAGLTVMHEEAESPVLGTAWLSRDPLPDPHVQG